MADTEIFMGVIGLFILLLLASPFFIKRNSTIERLEEDFQDEKEQVFMQLSELEYDYQMGKLPEKDYAKTKSELTSRASKYVSHSNEDLMGIERMVDIEIKKALKNSGVGKEITYEK
jgi:tagatose-1,6-bisphosphate aldolase